MILGRPRKPVAINKKHFTKKEREERMEQELKVPFTDVKAPAYLDAKQKKEFNEYAVLLVKLDLLTELDVDILAQFVIAKTLYLKYTKQLSKIIDSERTIHKWAVIDEITSNCESAEDLKELLEKILRRQRGEDLTVIMSLQDKAFKQCIACAKELGLTVTSRLRLAIPPPPDDDDEEL